MWISLPYRHDVNVHFFDIFVIWLVKKIEHLRLIFVVFNVFHVSLVTFCLSVSVTTLQSWLLSHFCIIFQANLWLCFLTFQLSFYVFFSYFRRLFSYFCCHFLIDKFNMIGENSGFHDCSFCNTLEVVLFFSLSVIQKFTSLGSLLISGVNLFIIQSFIGFNVSPFVH